MDRLVMPEDVTVIEDWAFAKDKSLKHADLRNVRYIGAHAFQECSNLETVIMSRATVIGAGAFEFCRSLISVDFSSVTEVGEAAFSFCGMLDIPEPKDWSHPLDEKEIDLGVIPCISAAELSSLPPKR